MVASLWVSHATHVLQQFKSEWIFMANKKRVVKFVFQKKVLCALKNEKLKVLLAWPWASKSKQIYIKSFKSII